MLLILSSSSVQPPRAGALPPPPLETLRQVLKDDSVAIDWLAGDGSDRCYYRLRSKAGRPSYVLMQLSGSDAQALQADGYDWINIATVLRDSGVPVPKVVEVLPKEASIIIQDYGDMTIETEALRLSAQKKALELKKLYLQLFDLIATMLSIPSTDSSVWCKRAFDAAKLHWEIEFFLRHYASPIAGLNFSGADKARFDSDALALAKYLSSHSLFFTHRDFHSRNVMFQDGKLAVIDFQDSRLGPPSYDLVSLVFDSYVPFSAEFRLELLNSGINRISKSNGDSVAQQIADSWQPMLLQRQLKAIGSFGYLTRVKGKGDYLRYVRDALATIPSRVVGDSRWPFISGPLLEQLADASQ